MRQARIESFRREKGGLVITIDIDGGALTPYEFDHAGEILGAYLLCIGFQSIIGPTSVRSDMSDAELEAEFDDFTIVDGRTAPRAGEGG